MRWRIIEAFGAWIESDDPNFNPRDVLVCLAALMSTLHWDATFVEMALRRQCRAKHMPAIYHTGDIVGQGC